MKAVMITIIFFMFVFFYLFTDEMIESHLYRIHSRIKIIEKFIKEKRSNFNKDI